MISISKENKTGKEIVDRFMDRNEDFITHDERIAVIKMVCQSIVKKDPLQYYSSTETKELYAASIVKAFPCLGTKNLDSQGKVKISHDVYFHPQAGGFIENHLKEIRRRNGIRKRRPNINNETKNSETNPDVPSKRKKAKKGQVETDKPAAVEDDNVMKSMVKSVFFSSRIPAQIIYPSL